MRPKTNFGQGVKVLEAYWHEYRLKRAVVIFGLWLFLAHLGCFTPAQGISNGLFVNRNKSDPKKNTCDRTESKFKQLFVDSHGTRKRCANLFHVLRGLVLQIGL